MLAELDDYMEAGVHIGMRRKVKHMEPFIYFTKRNRLSVIDVEKTDERIQSAAQLLAQYDPEEILVVSQKPPGHEPVEAFQNVTGVNILTGRFMPGTLTNPNADDFIEPGIIVVTDPVSDEQAVTEAVDANIPIIALCDTANPFENIDFAIPANNKGRNALGLLYYLLADQYVEARGSDTELDPDNFYDTPDEDELDDEFSDEDWEDMDDEFDEFDEDEDEEDADEEEDVETHEPSEEHEDDAAADEDTDADEEDEEEKED